MDPFLARGGSAANFLRSFFTWLSMVRSLTTRRVRLVHAVEKSAGETPPHIPGLIGHDDGSQSRNGKEIELKTWGTTARRTLGILALVAMIPAAGFAFGGYWGGGKPKSPPQEAIDACAGMSEGDTVQFTTPRGDTVSGICREIRGGLIAVPEGGFPGKHRGMGPGNRFARMAKKLGLTETQQEQVKAILESEREKAAPLLQQLAENREKIRKAIEAEHLDEAAVRTLAASQNETRVELVVSRARAKSEIFALLTPEQRESARKLRPWGEGRHGHRTWM